MTASFAVEMAQGFQSDGSTFAMTPTSATWASGGPTDVVTRKALLIRNLILGSEFMMSHITHFYHLAALDYVMGPPMAPWTPYFDTPSGDWASAQASGGLGITYPSSYQSASGFRYYFGALRPGFSTVTLTGAGTSGAGVEAGVVTSAASAYVIPGYDFASAVSAAGATVEGSAANAFNPLNSGAVAASSPVDEINKQESIWSRVIKDYVDALHIRRRILEAGGKLAGGLPMFRCLVAGGVTINPTSSQLSGGSDSYAAVLNDTTNFINQRYLPLVQIVAAIYKSYDNQKNETNNSGAAFTGIGAGWGNYLAWGVFNGPSAHSAMPFSAAGLPNDANAKKLFSRGYFLNFSTGTPNDIDPGISGTSAKGGIVEYIDQSWYEDTAGNAHPKHPYEGYTNPDKSKASAYTWAKAPRIIHTDLSAYPAEVGPLARMWVSRYYDSTTTGSFTGHAYLKVYQVSGSNLISTNLAATHIYALQGGLGDTNFQNGLVTTWSGGASVMDRHRARALEASRIASAASIWLSQLNQPDILSQKSYVYLPLPTESRGYGAHEAPRGALAHFIVADSAGQIENYQAVVPSTWNDSASTNDGKEGPIEKAILNPTLTTNNWYGYGPDGNTHLVPVEVTRVIRSFDPCLACTVHLIEKEDEGKGVK